jgi:hypothetical protein
MLGLTDLSSWVVNIPAPILDYRTADLSRPAHAQSWAYQLAGKEYWYVSTRGLKRLGHWQLQTPCRTIVRHAFFNVTRRDDGDSQNAAVNPKVDRQGGSSLPLIVGSLRERAKFNGRAHLAWAWCYKC